jgi:hypothetical protein
LTLDYPITDNALRWLEAILAERFGHAWQLRRTAECLELSLVDTEGKIIFDNLSKSLTEADSNQPYSLWDAEQEGWVSVLGDPLPAPGEAGLPSPLIEQKYNNSVVHYDILGLTYWMLARVEEIARADLDEHERFPASSSHAYKHGYLDRPVVDEWMHILNQVIKRQWPKVQLCEHKYKIIVTCDVDHPFLYTGKVKKVMRRFAGDLIKRRSVIRALKNLVGELCVPLGFWNIDPNFRGLDFIMKQCEEKNITASFFFITYITDDNLDADGGINKNVTKLFNLIHKRGHEIGIHPGYNSFNNREKINKTYELLVKTFRKEGINQKKIGSRQHYLRWSTTQTPRILQENNLSFDTTLGYADMAGFRCGTCYQYLMFDALEQKILSLKQKPLIVMDGSVFNEKYMNLDQSSASEYILRLKGYCKKVDGSFVLLWHNSFFGEKKYYDLFIKIVE